MVYQGVVFDLPAGTGMPGFAFGYAVAAFVSDPWSRTKPGGAERDRTVDLLNAIQALSQLSYGPTGTVFVAKGGVHVNRPSGMVGRSWPTYFSVRGAFAPAFDLYDKLRFDRCLPDHELECG